MVIGRALSKDPKIKEQLPRAQHSASRRLFLRAPVVVAGWATTCKCNAMKGRLVGNSMSFEDFTQLLALKFSGP